MVYFLDLFIGLFLCVLCAFLCWSLDVVFFFFFCVLIIEYWCILGVSNIGVLTFVL